MLRLHVSKMLLLSTLVFIFILGFAFISEYTHADVVPPSPRPKPVPNVNPNIDPQLLRPIPFPRPKHDVNPSGPIHKRSPSPKPTPGPADDKLSSRGIGATALSYVYSVIHKGVLFVATGVILVGLETFLLVGLIRTRKRKLNE